MPLKDTEQIYRNIPTKKPFFQQNLQNKDGAVSVEYYSLFVHENEKILNKIRKIQGSIKLKVGKIWIKE